jgi:hypothetical protein
MRLEYNGVIVEPGQKYIIDDGVWVVDRIIEPHKPSSTGRIEFHLADNPDVTNSYYPSVINASWKGREDQFMSPIVRWTKDDVKVIRPDWTDSQCNRYLDHVCKKVETAMVEAGWGILRNEISTYESEVMPTA